MPKPQKNEPIGPVGEALLLLAQELRTRAAIANRSTPPELTELLKQLGKQSYSDGLRDAAQAVEDFARS